jgi:Flp pilus assembly pilin Flp
MEKSKRLISVNGKREERGYTLLEYAAGAALIAIIVGITVTAIGTGFTNLGGSIGTWATREGTELLANNPNP